MRVVIQRVEKSDVVIKGEVKGSIGQGLALLVGFTTGDTIADIEFLVKKIVNLRIFDNEHGIMNKSILDIKGEVLSISQFTLYADTKGGNRPSYSAALKATEATILYDMFNKKLCDFVPTKTGVFGAEMKVNITNDGPVTIIIDSKQSNL